MHYYFHFHHCKNSRLVPTISNIWWCDVENISHYKCNCDEWIFYFLLCVFFSLHCAAFLFCSRGLKVVFHTPSFFSTPAAEISGCLTVSVLTLQVRWLVVAGISQLFPLDGDPPIKKAQIRTSVCRMLGAGEFNWIHGHFLIRLNVVKRIFDYMSSIIGVRL